MAGWNAVELVAGGDFALADEPLIGAALGIDIGMFLAGLTTLALSDYGVVFAVPYRTLAAFVAVAILAGMLAAILPARRRVPPQRAESAPVRVSKAREAARLGSPPDNDIAGLDG